MTALTMGLGKKQPSDVKEDEIENRLRESNEGLESLNRITMRRTI